ncbi:hypothetical protein WJX77_009574 [Trebouxia sp. C0004]
MKREACEDRGSFAINDGYSPSDKIDIANHYMLQNGVAPTKHLAMFLMMDGTLMRGDDTRRLQLCDLFWHPVRQVRPHQGFALGAVTDQGKTNKNGRVEFAWIMRHRDPLQCGVGATLRWLLWRHEFIEDRKFPDFSSRRAWYNTYLFYGSSKPQVQSVQGQG